jgi:hypothetical protein
MLVKRDNEIADNEGMRQLTQLKKRLLILAFLCVRTSLFPSDQGEQIYDIFVEPLKNEQGKITGASTVAFNITNSKKLMEKHHGKQ